MEEAEKGISEGIEEATDKEEVAARRGRSLDGEVFHKPCSQILNLSVLLRRNFEVGLRKLFAPLEM